MNIAKLFFIPNSLKRKLLQLFHFKVQPFIYVALGDSTAEGVGATQHNRSYTSIVYSSLQSRYRNSRYINLARKGAILSDVLSNQLQQAINSQPSLITISIGANDIRNRTDLNEFENNLYSLLKSLHKKTDATIVISTIPDLSFTPAVPKILKKYSQYKAGKLNNIILKVGKATNSITVDLFEDSKTLLKAFPEAIAEDGFHPSDFGYAIWANTILVTLRNVLAPVFKEKEK